MAHLFRAKSFIRAASANADGVDGTLPDDVEKYLESQDAGGASLDIDEVLAVTSCSLSGDRIFTLVIIEDQIAGG